MAQLLVRDLDDDVKAKLQRRARRHRRSTAEEVREILRNAVRDEGGSRKPLGSRLAARFASFGLEEDIPELRVQIAGIATARRATLATRDLRHFAGLGVELVDPWSA